MNDGLTVTVLAEFVEGVVFGDQATDTISISGVIGVADFSATGSETKGDATADLITVKGSVVGNNGFTLTGDANFEDSVTLGDADTETVYIHSAATATHTLSVTGTATLHVL